MAFTEAYQALLARWPGPVQEATVPTVYGPTRVNIAGPEGQPPLVLLPGGGATSTAWFAVAKDLVRHRRVYAIDLMGDAGLSRNTGTPLRTTADLLAWLDAVTDHLGLRLFDLGGHSYGGWLALTYALHAPQRIRKLALLDPTGCFAGFSPRYLAHALPLLAKATPKRARKLVAWEARGQKVDEGWLGRLPRTTACRPSTPPRPRRPCAASWAEATASGGGAPHFELVDTGRHIRGLRRCRLIRRV